MSEVFDCIIIGAGFSGLIAARELNHAGYLTVIMDANDRIGGRTMTSIFPGTAQKVELGGTWINPKYHRWVRRELERYALPVAGNTDITPEAVWTSNGSKSLGWPLTAADNFDFERALFQIIDDSLLVDTETPRDQQDLAFLDVSFDAYIGKLGLSPKVGQMLRTLGMIGTGAQAEEWSALTALSWVAASDNSAYAWIAGVAEKFKDGTDGAIRAISAETSQDIRLNTLAVSVEQDADSVRVGTADGKVINGRSVILAIPLNCWRDIAFTPALSPPKNEAVLAGQPGRMKKVWLLVKGMPDTPMHIGLDTTFCIAIKEYKSGGHDLVVAFSGSDTLDVEDGPALQAALSQLAPEAELVAHMAHDWFADPHAKGTWMANRPGQLSTSATVLQTMEGRIAFAGADIATRWIGWIDGAIERGFAAAGDIGTMLEAERSISR